MEVPHRSCVSPLCLPNELILFIINDLDESDLISCLYLCKRLYHLALPRLFSRRFNIDVSKEFDLSLLLCSSPHSLDQYRSDGTLLQALRAVSFSFSIGRLQCVLHDPGPSRFSTQAAKSPLPSNTEQHIQVLLRVLSDLTGFVSRANLSHVSRVIIDVHCHPYARKDKPPGAEAWIKGLHHLVHALNAKKCIHLTITWSDPVKPNLGALKRHPVYDSGSSQTAPTLRNTLARLRQGNSPVRDSSPTPGTPVVQMSTLQSINVHSPLFLQAPVVDWTISTLNASRITDISFNALYLDTQGWSELLRRIFLPTVAKLSITSTSLYFIDLASFLSRHPSIVSLDLDGCLRHNEKSATAPHLHQLTTLRATPDYVAQLLTMRVTLNSAFPVLKAITIRTRPQRGQGSATPDPDAGAEGEFAIVRRALASLRSLPADDVSLSLEIFNNHSLTDWLTHLRGDGLAHRASEASGPLSLARVTTVRLEASAGRSRITGATGTTTAWSSVSRANLARPVDESILVSLLPAWLAVTFPNVESVRIDGRLLPGPSLPTLGFSGADILHYQQQRLRVLNAVVQNAVAQRCARCGDGAVLIE
jgi:hypothetical protein